MATIIIALIWLGILIGISFIATPVKFHAPSLTLPVALDVGRYTFALFSKVEIVLAGALFMLVLRTWQIELVVIAAALGMIVAMQVFWLLPKLDARVALILGGGAPPRSSLHWIYISFDVTKALLLSAAIYIGFRSI